MSKYDLGEFKVFDHDGNCLGALTDLEVNGVTNEPIFVVAGDRVHDFESIRASIDLEMSSLMLLDPLELPLMPDFSPLERLRMSRDRSIKGTTYVEPPLTHQDLERIEAAKAKRARKAAKLRKETKQ